MGRWLDMTGLGCARSRGDRAVSLSEQAEDERHDPPATLNFAATTTCYSYTSCRKVSDIRPFLILGSLGISCCVPKDAKASADGTHRKGSRPRDPPSNTPASVLWHHATQPFYQRSRPTASRPPTDLA